MVGTWFGLELARRGLIANTTGLSVTSHNISNAANEGYSRQRAELGASIPYAEPAFFSRPDIALLLGSGVNVQSIARVRDEFLDSQIIAQTQLMGEFATIDSYFGQLEIILADSEEGGLQSAMSGFFTALQELANNPEVTGVRAALKETTITLARTYNEIESQISQLRDDMNTLIRIKVDELNNYTHQIAALNEKIRVIESMGDNPNDLLDQRALLVEKMAEIVNLSVSYNDNGSIAVQVGGLKVVNDDLTHDLTVRRNSEDSSIYDVMFAGTTDAPILRGQLGALLEMRDVVIPGVLSSLNELAATFVNSVNQIHLDGYGLDGASGRALFEDYHIRDLRATSGLGAGVTEETTLFDLGITAGKFIINGQTIEIADDEANETSTFTLGDLLERITDEAPYVRARLETFDPNVPRVILELWNPPDANVDFEFDTLGTNFFTVASLDNATSTITESFSAYRNAMDNMALSFHIVENLDSIAAAQADENGGFAGPGDNRNALEMADLQFKLFGIGEQGTFLDLYNSVISDMGVQSQQNGRLMENQGLLLNQLTNTRESISGVNMDEEVLNIIQFQRGFEGAARAMTVIDSMLDIIVNRLGVTR